MDFFRFVFLSIVALSLYLLLTSSVGFNIHSERLLLPSSVDSVYKKNDNIPNYSPIDSIKSLQQKPSNRIDTNTVLQMDTFAEPTSENGISDPINYDADDSIIYDIKNKKIYLFGGGKIDYQSIHVTGDLIDIDQTTYTITAMGKEDSSGNISGNPVLKDGEKAYNAKKFSYNFKTKKGKVYEVITEDGGGYVRLGEGKRTDDSSWYGKNVWFTTCNEVEHPHFYIQAKKAKIIPNKLIVTGPANLVIADIPTPLYVPFGIFPLKQGQRSGIIFPQYGDRGKMGFFLRGGGYYFAIKDRAGISLTGDIYTRGSWGLSTSIQYATRYRFKGGISFSYFRTRPSNPEVPGLKPSNDFTFKWSHSQESQARPFSSFSAAVNFQTSSYNQNNSVYGIVTQNLLNTVVNSNVNYVKSWRGMPFQLSLSAQHNQNLRTKLVRIDLPILNFNISRINPFKSKVQKAKSKWYEVIGVNYQLEAKSLINTYDSLLFKESALKRIQYGVKQVANIDAPFSLFKYLKVNPNFSFTERFYFKSVAKSWDPETLYILKDSTRMLYDTVNGRIITDTIEKFRAVHEFNLGINLSTKLTGIYKFKNAKVKALRHVFTPSVGFTYHPNFGSSKWNYWDKVQKDNLGNFQKYSRFENSNELYGVPGDGLQGTMSFGINNDFELKAYSKKDSVTHEKKIPLLDNLSLRASYNFAADSLRLSPFVLGFNSRAIPNIRLNFSMELDPYSIDTNGRRFNTSLWETKHKLLRVSTTNFNISGTFASKNKLPDNTAANGLTNKTTDEEKEFVLKNPEYFYDFTVPWSITFAYNFNIRRAIVNQKDTSLITQSISTSIDFNLTPKWKLSASSGFDFVHLEPTLTQLNVIRDLHCWELSFNWTAYPVRYQTYMITLKVKSPILQDLKLTKRSNNNDIVF